MKKLEKDSKLLNNSYNFDGKKYSRVEIEELLKTGFESFEKKPDQRLQHTLRMIEGKDVLDVGCAAGGLSKKISLMGKKVLGIDVLEDAIKIAREFNSTPNTTFEVRDLLKQQFPENSFDCITFLETIEHVENPGLYLRELHRILRPKGFLILSTPNATSLKNIFYALSYRKKAKRVQISKEISSEPKHTGTQIEHVNNWDFPTLVRLLDRCGFDVVDHAFARSGPIIIPFFGKKIEIIKLNSKILKRWEPLMTTHVIKAQKRAS